MNPGPEGINNVLFIAGFPWAGDLEALFIQSREEQLQHGVSLPYTEEELKLVERVTAMHVTLLPQAVQHYPRGLTGQAYTLLQDVKRFADP
mmetsp:Transcript_55123/g.115348  ORF Transcript_55123/g.115348 Transcript_55123/m.115348 type:complete len:91 (+) Transcript_55123:148-420(+)|eukprot:CAMPEP_0172160172 /NCGR_PEP_ID=MMETSP1050-20130122/5411_1 /TAXON_ID=233186 /ORGANISM="Cryptomonas curvata, Strain CCAP979/52" /LENGTH=90 /DNA_ID=CAMNT_0012829907 /DNA_START=4108 /DNA_END=4380 /DNA_ORIENTATION=+